MENSVEAVDVDTNLIGFVKKYKELGLSAEDCCKLWHFHKLQGVIRLNAEDYDLVKSIYAEKAKKSETVAVVIPQKKK